MRHLAVGDVEGRPELPFSHQFWVACTPPGSGAFEFKKEPFAADPVAKGIAAERRAFADHPVAGYEDRYRVGAAGPADGTGSGFEVVGDIPVAPCPTVRYALDNAPHGALKIGAVGVERKIEPLPLAREVLPYLRRRCVQEKGCGLL